MNDPAEQRTLILEEGSKPEPMARAEFEEDNGDNAQETVMYEAGMDLDFLEEVHKIPGGEHIKRCVQCGTCSGSCPVSWAMEETPRQVFAMIRAGMRDRALDSATIWTCASCYSCAVRCPQQIKITDIMYALKRMSIQERRRSSGSAQALSKHFIALVNRFGRNHEIALMTHFILSSRPLGVLTEGGIGLKLMLRGRLPFRNKSIKDIDGLKRIIARAVEMGGDS